jgi:hypothetical protein
VKLPLPFALKLTASGRVRADVFDTLEPGNPPQRELAKGTRTLSIGDRIELELRELHVQRTFRQGLLTLGKQQVVWGRSDGLKVLDVVNPQNFREFILDDFARSRIPLWMANVESPLGDFVVQVLWVPDQSAHRLAPAGAPFAFTAPSLRPGPPPPFVPATTAVDRPNRLLADADVGIRVARLWKGWDLTANYLFHYDDRPVILGPQPPEGTAPNLTATYRRSHLGGGSFANAFGPVALRGEIAASFDRFFPAKNSLADPPVQSPGVAYVIGCDWLAPRGLFLSVQLFQDRVVRHASELAREPVETTTTLFARRAFRQDTMTLQVMWLQGVSSGDGLVRPLMTYAVSDAVSVWIGVDVFYGQRGGLFGQFDQNDRLAAGIRFEM